MVFELDLNADTVQQTVLEEPHAVAPETTLRATLELLRQRRIHCVLICGDGRLIGIFTERDALQVMASGADLGAPVETAMSARPVTVTADTSMAEAIRTMSEGGFRRLPVVDDAGRPTGVLTVTDIVHYLVEHVPSAVYTLPPRPHHSTRHREGA